jgi:hypothetical protein
VALLVGVVLLVPIGRYEAYPSRALAQTLLVHSCRVLPSTAVGTVVGAHVHDRESTLARPHVAVEEIMPSISRNACVYHWPAECGTDATLSRLELTVIAMPNADQALARYRYAREILHQGSYSANHFADFRLARRQAYRLVIERTVIIRVLDGRFIVDLQPRLCDGVPGARAQEATAGLVRALRLPVATKAYPR